MGNNGTKGDVRRNKVFDMYVRGCTVTEIAKSIGVSRQRIEFLIRYKYKFLPQSRYMLEGALAREWMLRHRPAEFRRIVGEAAEQHCDSTDKGE